MRLDISPTEISVVCGTDLSTTIADLSITYTNEFSHVVEIDPRSCVYSPNIKEKYHINEDTDVYVSYGFGEYMSTAMIKYTVLPNKIDMPISLVANDFVASLGVDPREKIVAYIQYESGKQEAVPYTNLLIVSVIDWNMIDIPQKVLILEQNTQLKCELYMTIEKTAQADVFSDTNASVILSVIPKGEIGIFAKNGVAVMPINSDIKSDAGWEVYYTGMDETETKLDPAFWTITGVDTSKPGVYVANLSAIVDGKLYTCYRTVTIMDMGGEIPSEDSGFVVRVIRDEYSADKPFEPEIDLRVYMNGVNIAPSAYTTIGFMKGKEGTITVLYTVGSGLEAITYSDSFDYTWKEA